MSLVFGIQNLMLKWVIPRFSAESFFLTVAKKSLKQFFRVSIISGTKKFYAEEGYVTIFCRSFFVFQCRKLS